MPDFNIASMFQGSKAAGGGGVPNAAAVASHAATGNPAPGAAATAAPGTGGTGTQTVGDGTTDVTDPNANARNPDGTLKTTAPSSPLDAFGDLFKIDDKKQPPANPLAERLMELDPKKFGEAVAKMDFTRQLNPELVSKALQGDAASFNAALNQALQGTFATMMQMVVGINEAAFSKNNQRFDSVLGQRFRDFQISFSKPENKVLQHPAAQPVLAAMRKHIADNNPELGPSDVGKRAEEYFLAMGDAMATLKKQTEETDLRNKGGPGASAGSQDWTAFLEEGAKSI